MAADNSVVSGRRPTQEIGIGGSDLLGIRWSSWPKLCCRRVGDQLEGRGEGWTIARSGPGLVGRSRDLVCSRGLV